MKTKLVFNPDLKIPFDFNGHMMTYARATFPEVRPPPINSLGLRQIKEWRDNKPFAATLRVSNFQRGPSAAHFILKDDAGHEYVMFAKFLLEALQGDTCYSGWLHGKWAFAKRGANYSIIKL